MLVVVSAAWLLLTTPYAVFTLAVPEFSTDRQTRATQALLRTVCFLLMYVNHAVNFVLYCLTGRKFRAELRDMTRALCPRPARRRWVATSPSMRTTRSNCVELEPLNNDVPPPPPRASVTTGHHGSTTHQHQQHDSAARRAFFVGDPANEVVVVPRRDVSDDAVGCHGDGSVKEDAV